MTLYLYRTLDVDDDGDPYDHGVLRADGWPAVRELLAERLRSIFGEGETYETYVYPIEDSLQLAGVLATDDRALVTVTT